HKFGPQDWTDINHPTASAYVKSKTLAEKAAWDFVADHPDMQLTTIHPGLVCGTPMDRHFGTSLEVIERIWLGKDPMVPNFCLPVVDLADVSALHVAALNTPASVGQRVIAAESAWMYPEMASILKQAFPDRKISDRKAPKLVLRLLSMFDPAVKSILPQLDRVLEIDNSNARSLFDHHFVSGREAMIASAKFLEAQQNG
ncbi:MAG: aldehyde reductase, partial [Pseudomonadota bacterium]